MNQIERLQEYLEKGHEITPIEALNLFGCFRLSARILELRRKGMAIDTRIVRDGKKHFAAYRLAV